MVSMAFSTPFSIKAPFKSSTQYKTANSSYTCTPPMALLNLSSKIPSGFSKSPFVSLRLRLQPSQLSGFLSKTATSPGIVYATAATEKSFHDFNVKDIDGKGVSPSKFKGGLTTSNYTELSHIYEKYKSQGIHGRFYARKCISSYPPLMASGPFLLKAPESRHG